MSLLIFNADAAEDVPECPEINQRNLDDGIEPKYKLNPKAGFAKRRPCFLFAPKMLIEFVF